MTHKIRLVSFDLDDTLWPCRPTILRAEAVLYQWLSDNVPQITQRYSLEQLREKRYALYQLEPGLVHDLSRLRIRSFELLAEELSLDSDWINPAFQTFYQARQQVTLYADVKPVLDELSSLFQLASLTNGNASTVETGIDHWFDYSLNSAMVGSQKSEPHIYRELQHLAGIETGQMVHVGDHPQQDIAGARSAGVFAIWLNRENLGWPDTGFEPDAIINDLYQLPGLLDAI